jgi:hypothetical protein
MTLQMVPQFIFTKALTSFHSDVPCSFLRSRQPGALAWRDCIQSAAALVCYTGLHGTATTLTAYVCTPEHQEIRSLLHASLLHRNSMTVKVNM